MAIAPVVPQITDHELDHLVEAAAEAKARGVFYLPVRLPHEVAPLFRAWLEQHFPDRSGKVMATINALRGGKDNDSRFGSRMRGEGVWADLLRQRVAKACARLGYGRDRVELDLTQFRPPAASAGQRQGTLF